MLKLCASACVRVSSPPVVPTENKQRSFQFTWAAGTEPIPWVRERHASTPQRASTRAFSPTCGQKPKETNYHRHHRRVDMHEKVPIMPCKQNTPHTIAHPAVLMSGISWRCLRLESRGTWRRLDQTAGDIKPKTLWKIRPFCRSKSDAQPYLVSHIRDGLLTACVFASLLPFPSPRQVVFFLPRVTCVGANCQPCRGHPPSVFGGPTHTLKNPSLSGWLLCGMMVPDGTGVLYREDEECTHTTRRPFFPSA